MNTATRRLEIDAGHRLLGHDGKCKNYHGHRYAFEITVHAPVMEDGMIVDFGLIKKKVGEWLETHWDHGMILQDGDPLIGCLEWLGTPTPKIAVLSCPPTAENLARELWMVARTLLDENLSITRVRCWETPFCFADYYPQQKRFDWETPWRKPILCGEVF